MNFVQLLVDLFLHLDKHLSTVITQYGAWTYGLLFVVIFIETGLVVTPFLPGDFAALRGGDVCCARSLERLAIVPVARCGGSARRHRELLDWALSW